MGTLSFYGKRLVIIEVENGNKTKQDILDRFENLSKKYTRQKERVKKDIEYAKTLDDNKKYACFWVQIVGHRETPNRHQYSGKLHYPDYYSNVIMWN